jgi:hypothetical protein
VEQGKPSPALVDVLNQFGQSAAEVFPEYAEAIQDEQLFTVPEQPEEAPSPSLEELLATTGKEMLASEMAKLSDVTERYIQAIKEAGSPARRRKKEELEAEVRRIKAHLMEEVYKKYPMGKGNDQTRKTELENLQAEDGSYGFTASELAILDAEQAQIEEDMKVLHAKYQTTKLLVAGHTAILSFP